MNLLHLIPSLRKGGAERLVLDICRELAKRKGIRCKLVVMHEVNEYPHLTKGVDIVFCSSRVVPSITSKWQVDISAWQQIVEAFQPDVIHSHLFEAEMLSRFWLYPKAAYFSHCHDNIAQLNKFATKTLASKMHLANYYERQFMLKQYKKVNNQFVAISTHTQNHFKAHLPNNFFENIHLLHNAIDYNAFHTPIKRKIDTPIKLVTVGSLVPNKNHIFLFEVVNLLKQRGLQVELHLLGEGSERRKLEEKIVTLGLSDQVFLHGNVNNVQDYLNEATLYVHSAFLEAFGLVMLEAMAAGLPVVCLNGKGNVDIMEEGKNGFMVEELDPELFSEKIATLINDQNLYKEVSNHAQQFAVKFDIKSYVDKLLCLYDATLKSKTQSLVTSATNA